MSSRYSATLRATKIYWIGGFLGRDAFRRSVEYLTGGVGTRK